MNELLQDIKEAFNELIGQSNSNTSMDTAYERSKYDSFCVMAIDMRVNGYSVREIADRLGVTKKKVKEMLAYKSVARVNRTGGSRYE